MMSALCRARAIANRLRPPAPRLYRSKDTATSMTSRRGTSIPIVCVCLQIFLSLLENTRNHDKGASWSGRLTRSFSSQGPAGQRHLEGPACFNHDLQHIFCKSLPSQHEAIQRALKMLSGGHPHRSIILMTESLNFGALPIALGA